MLMNNREDYNIHDRKIKSLIITFLNRLAAFIYSLFTDTWIGRKILSGETSYDSITYGKY